MKFQRRRAVSELLATVMMIGVTLSVGGFITAGAISQFNLAQGSASLAASVQQQSAGKLISLVYSMVSGGSCAADDGYTMGTTFTLELYDYGTISFSPTEAFVNNTLYSGTSVTGSTAANSMSAITLTLTSCAHPSGQTILLVDSYGDEVQIGT